MSREIELADLRHNLEDGDRERLLDGQKNESERQSVDATNIDPAGSEGHDNDLLANGNGGKGKEAA